VLDSLLWFLLFFFVVVHVVVVVSDDSVVIRVSWCGSFTQWSDFESVCDQAAIGDFKSVLPTACVCGVMINTMEFEVII
jgi:hypothetical protein